MTAERMERLRRKAMTAERMERLRKFPVSEKNCEKNKARSRCCGPYSVLLFRQS